MTASLAAILATVAGGLSAPDLHVRIRPDDPSATGPAPQLRVRADPGDVEPLPAWELWVGASGGYRMASGVGGFSGRIGLNRRLTDLLRAELELGTGAWLSDEQTLNLMHLGLRLELPGERLTPYVYAAFAHHHEVAFADARRAPLGAALGLSDNGEIHRSGLDGGIGVALTLPRAPRSTNAVRVGLRAGACAMLGKGPPVTADVVFSVGSTF